MNSKADFNPKIDSKRALQFDYHPFVPLVHNAEQISMIYIAKCQM